MTPRDGSVYFITIPLLLLVVLSGCGGGWYSLKYEPSPEDSTSRTMQPIAVALLQFDDARPPEERVDSARGRVSDHHPGDYTYDKDFRGAVNDGISRTISSSLSHAQVFSKIDYIPITPKNMSLRSYDSLRAVGVDAVLAGSIHHFFGYLATSAADDLVPLATGVGFCIVPYLLMPTVEERTYYVLGRSYTVLEYDNTPYLVSSVATPLGYFLGSAIVSSRDREVQSRTDISFQLVDTRTRRTLWKDTIIAHRSEHNSVSGMNRCDVATQALKRVAKELATHLSQLSLSSDISNEPMVDAHTYAREEISLNEPPKQSPSQLRTSLSFAAGFRPTNEVLGGIRVGFIHLPHDMTLCINFTYDYEGSSLAVRQLGLGAEYPLLRMGEIQVYSHCELFVNALTPSNKDEYFRGGLGLDLGLTAPISRSIRLGLEGNYQFLNLIGRSAEESITSEFTPIIRLLFDF